MPITMTTERRVLAREQLQFDPTMVEKSCICRNAVACKGLTAGFACLDDPRGGFVRLPRYEPNPTSSYYVERNAQRAAYLRHLLPDHVTEEETEAKHVAMHHFHAKIVSELTPQRRFPKVLSEDDMDRLGMTKRAEERVLEDDGEPTGFYVFVPTYPIEMAKNDIKRLLGICKVLNTEEKRKENQHAFALDLTSFSEPETGSPTPGAAFLDSDSEEENLDDMGKFLPWHLKEAVVHHQPPQTPPMLTQRKQQQGEMRSMSPPLSPPSPPRAAAIPVSDSLAEF